SRDWSSDVCSSDLDRGDHRMTMHAGLVHRARPPRSAGLLQPPGPLGDEPVRTVAVRRDLHPTAHAPGADHAAQDDVPVLRLAQAVAAGALAPERLTSIATVSDSFAPRSFQNAMRSSASRRPSSRSEAIGL